jgi:tyrosine-specific transport protein
MNTKKEGSVFGGILLIAGSCIGAGMLGLPILTGMAGFFPSLIMFMIAAFFMTTTALLLVEVNGWFSVRSNFITMVSAMLGKWGRLAVWVLYLFLFYALSVAYIADSGHHLSSFLAPFGVSIPVFAGSIFFVLLFGWIVYLGTRPVDFLNRIFMAGKILAYILLLFTAFRYVKVNNLKYVNLDYVIGVLPILVLSFGFHNMIPTLSHYLNGDIKRIRMSILGGVFLTLVIYLFWQIIALGALPVKGSYGIFASFEKGIDAASSLKNFVDSKSTGFFAQTLAFFAILTSFLAQTLSLVHFLSDGLKVEHKKRENIWMCLLALLPPLIFAMIYPGIFYKALGFAGGVSAVIVFGIFPVIMCYRGRYIEERSSRYKVFGGKPLLLLIFSIASFILVYQLYETFLH